MAGRPEILFPLFAGLEQLPGIGPKSAKTLADAGIATPRDLLFTLPHSVIDRRPVASVLDITPPATATIEVQIGRHMPPLSRGRPYRIEVTDAKTTFQLVFFHAREDYLRRQLPEGEIRLVSGKVELFDSLAQMVHPDHILIPGADTDLPEYEPVYPLTAGITQKTMSRAAQGALDRAPDLPEWIDPALVERDGWPDWRAALRAAHEPASAAAATPDTAARRRLAYDELFAHQTTLALARAADRRRPGIATRGDSRLRRKILAALTYTPTGAQTRVLAEIEADMAAPERMSRLLQGDVGAGKTLVALLALLIAVEAGGQGAFMAPTEILARQHLASLEPLLAPTGVSVLLLTGRDTGAARQEKLAAIASGAAQIVVGTHALFQKTVEFHDLRLAVVDEQHRFGVAQRMELTAKGRAVDSLVMTATPIPRSLSLATYGDMDISVLDEKPPGRTPVTTALVSAGRMDEITAHLRQAIAEGRQAYWVCPLVAESEVSDLTAAEERFAMLRAALGEGTVGLVHGQLPPAEKDAAMARFIAGETRLLVATTVIEVGVDVPRASIMVIERAEAFGLAQLHQLRGRVGRGAAASTCILLYRAPLGETAERRLKLLRDTDDGFRIAEEDLAMRGAGDLIGTAQSGLPRFRIADPERQAGLMATAQRDARAALAADPALSSRRGQAIRTLLWLMEQDKAFRYLSVG